MHEHEQSPAQSPSPGERAAARGVQAPAQALQQAIGNRALGRALQRMEATDAVEPLEKALGAGVLGAQRQVVETMTAFSGDPVGFDKVHVEYEKKTEAPLAPAIEGLVGPRGLFPGISGETAGES